MQLADDLDIRILKGLRFLVVKDYELVAYDDLNKADALVIEFISVQDTTGLLKMVRTHADRAVYLMPVYLSKVSEVNDMIIESLIDGRLTNLDKIEEVAERAAKIKYLAGVS
jgi:hypothetical protein